MTLGLRDFHPLERLAYAYYERRLERRVASQPLPHHIGLILDGNRRYARDSGLVDLAAGYRQGADKIDDVLRWCDDLEIPVVTLWGLSVENLGRDPEDLERLVEVIDAKIRELAAPPAGLRRRRIRVMGRLDLLPESTRSAAEAAEEATRDVEGYVLNIAVGYGGREEIADAVKKLFAERLLSGAPIEACLADITPETISKYLYVCDYPDPDLIIRTSGEVRLSGFMLWQSAYSEFYFCDAFWPAFRKIDLLRAIRSYQLRQRRFGL